MRSAFYRSWEVELRRAQDIPLSVSQMDAPEGAELTEARGYLIEGIAKGRPVGVVAKLRPDLFPTFDQLLINTGEGFGTLHESLRVLSEYYMRDHARMARIRGWITIPLIVGIMAAFVIPYPLLWDRGGGAYSAAIIAGIVGMYALGGIPVSLVYSLANRSKRVQRPRFAWALAMGLEGGLTFAGAARLAATVSNIVPIGRHLDGIPGKELKTMTLTAMLDGSGVWPAMLEQIRKADESSEYLSTLRVFAANLESPP
ncbi:MAG: type II secretion system F family protein [Gemmatimonadetes bacterium]|nr:type II secretion system F family protein [Gemmatimonadota bacterium]